MNLDKLEKELPPVIPTLYLSKMELHKNILVPNDEATNEFISKLHINDVLAVNPVWTQRNRLRFRKFMKMIRIAHDAGAGEGSTLESFRKRLIIEAGFYDTVIVEDLMFKIPNSTGFNNMHEYSFNNLFREVHKILIKKFGIDLPDSFLTDFF